MATSLKVGIIGASAERGWAKESHVPAVQKLDGLELAAVAAGSQSSADAAAKAFGAPRGYGKAQDLIADPGIDIVSIAVKVTDHRQLVLAALANGKHIYCEWPLGRNLAEAEELSEAARAAGVHCAIGVQARCSPAVRRAADRIASGDIGRVLSANIYSGTIAFSPKMGKADAYLEDAANGATLVSIHGGHAVDLAQAVLGDVQSLTALATTQYREVEISGEGAKRTRSIPDHLLVQALLAGDAALSIEVAGGRAADQSRFHLEVTGDKRTLALDGRAPRGFQSGRLHVSVNGEPEHLDEPDTASLPDTAANVGAVYAALRDDINRETRTVPDFAHAVRLTRLMDDLLTSSATGSRKSIARSASAS